MRGSLCTWVYGLHTCAFRFVCKGVLVHAQMHLDVCKDGFTHVSAMGARKEVFACECARVEVWPTRVCVHTCVCKDGLAHMCAYTGVSDRMGLQYLHMGLCKGGAAQVWASKWMCARRALHTGVQKG